MGLIVSIFIPKYSLCIILFYSGDHIMYSTHQCPESYKKVMIISCNNIFFNLNLDCLVWNINVSHYNDKLSLYFKSTESLRSWTHWIDTLKSFMIWKLQNLKVYQWRLTLCLIWNLGQFERVQYVQIPHFFINNNLVSH